MIVKCPVCGFDVDTNDPEEKIEVNGKEYYFCGKGCKNDFLKNKHLSKVNKVEEEIFEKTKTIAIVGLSPNKTRPSYQVAKNILKYGYDIIPIHPEAEIILGQKVYKNLDDIPIKYETIIVFLKPEKVDKIVETAITKKIKYIWLQEGLTFHKKDLISKENLILVEDRCFYKELKKFREQK